MAAFDFPSSPSVNQTYTANGVTWKWNGTMWMRVSGAGYLEKIEEGNSKIEVDDSGSGNVTVTTDGTERLRVTSAGNLGIGTNNPPNLLTLGASGGPTMRLADTTSGAFSIITGGSNGGLTFSADHGNTGSSTNIIFSNDGNQERLRIGSAGEVRIMTANGQLKWLASSGNDPFIRSIGSGQQSLEFNTGGSERLRITSAGRIGINETSPSHVLDVKSQADGTYFINGQNHNGNNIFQVYESSDGDGNHGMLYLNNGSGTTLTKISTNGSSYFNGGNIGIGDASPTKPLTVGTTTPVILLDDQSSRTLEIRGPSTTHSATILTTSAHDLLLGTNNTERLRIDSDGRLLLGLNSSIGGNAIFQVQGSGNKKAQFHQPDSGNCHIQFTNTQTGTSSNNGVEIGLGGDEQAQIWNYYNSFFRIGTNGLERLRIFNDGNVRIGDTSINLAAVGSGPTLGINGSAPEITLRDSASGNPYAVMRTNDFGSLTLEADAGNNASNSTIHFRVDASERMRINSSYLLHGDTASDLSGTHATMFCGSNHAFQHDGDTGTYLTIAVGAANGTVDLEADARSGGYPDMRFITTNSERVRIRANGDMTMRGTNSQYVEAAAFQQTAASKNAIVSNNGGYVTFESLRNTNSTIISHDPNSNSGRRITFPVAGAVHFSMYQDIITTGSTGYTQVRLYKNGTADRYALITHTNGQWNTIMMNAVVEVAANDYLEVYYSGGTITAMDNASWLSYNFIFYPINTNRG